MMNRDTSQQTISKNINLKILFFLRDQYREGKGLDH